MAKGYSIFPTSSKEIYNNDIRQLFETTISYCRAQKISITDPIALNRNEPNRIKVVRALDTDAYRSFMVQNGAQFRAYNGKYKSIGIYFGNGSRCGRGAASKGFEYEDHVYEDLLNYSNCRVIDDSYHEVDTLKKIVDTIGLEQAQRIDCFKEAESNTKRPFVFDNGIKIGKESNISDIGQSLTDITVVADGKVYYLSLKNGLTTTFINAGVRSFLTPTEIKSGSISNKNGKNFLDVLGIDNKLFCRVFNEYGSTNFSEYSKSYEVDNITNLLSSGIGAGYIMVHKLKNTKVFNVDSNYNKRNSTPIDNLVNIYYGGKSGDSKMILIELETEDYKFNCTIRNSSGRIGDSIYPTHFYMLYKYK